MRNPAVRAGLIFGLIVGGVGAMYQGAQLALFQSLGISSTGLSSPDPQASVQALSYLALLSGLGFILFLVYLGLYLWCGAVASRKNGSVGTGSIAGLIAGA